MLPLAPAATCLAPTARSLGRWTSASSARVSSAGSGRLRVQPGQRLGAIGCGRARRQHCPSSDQPPPTGNPSNPRPRPCAAGESFVFQLQPRAAAWYWWWRRMAKEHNDYFQASACTHTEANAALFCRLTAGARVGTCGQRTYSEARTATHSCGGGAAAAVQWHGNTGGRSCGAERACAALARVRCYMGQRRCSLHALPAPCSGARPRPSLSAALAGAQGRGGQGRAGVKHARKQRERALRRLPCLPRSPPRPLACHSTAATHAVLCRYALWLDADLASGISRNSTTFGNECLAGSPEFKVGAVEMWGLS